VAALAEEIETPGPGQVRALLTIAGNPVLSTPNAGRLDAALDTLDFMVSVDLYLNETTRHADVVLPALSPLEHSHFDLVFTVFSIRDVANYSPAVVAPPPGALDEWETLVRLLGIVTGQGPDADVAAIDDVIATEAVRRTVGDEHSPLAGRDVDDVLAELAPRTGPERLLDLALRTGPYRLTLADLEAAPHGLDLGPLKPRLPEVLRTPSGKVELAPEPLLADGRRLVDALGEPTPSDEQMLLIGRRDLRSNNSWMHNLPVLVRGKARCTAHVHPDDAARLGLVDGAPARVTSRTGTIEVPVELTEDIRPGVVSIPHGWGHGVGGARLGVAAAHAGVNSNVLADEELLEPVTGTAVLNGIPVTVEPAGTRDAVAGGAAGAAASTA
jgi:anaerobic selenocysteine-containing dehydrogenase